MPENKSRKRILIVYVTAGSGHVTFGRAIRTGLERLFPDRYDIREMDYIKEVGPASFDRSSKNVWAFMLRHPIVGRMTDGFVERITPLARAIELGWSRRHIENSVRFIRDYKPDLIIAPHPQTLRVAVITKERLGLSAPVVGIDIEPFKGSAVYGHPGADQIVVFSEQAKAGRVKRGVAADKVPVFDFILDSRFLKDYDSVDATRARFGLEPGRLTLLMSSGGDGIGGIEKYVRATIARDLPVQLAVVTGRNAGLKKRLEAAPPPPGSRTALKVFGFVENMSDLVHASDVVFGKSGACTTAESLFMRKPVIFYRYVTGNEKRSLDFVRDNGIGWYAPTPRRYVRIVESILRAPETLDRIRDTYRKLDFKSGTVKFCSFVADMLEAEDKRSAIR